MKVVFTGRILPGKTARVEQWAEEVQGRWASENTAFNRQAGIREESVFISPTPDGDIMVIVHEVDDLQHYDQALSAWSGPFAEWWLSEAREALGEVTDTRGRRIVHWSQ